MTNEDLASLIWYATPTEDGRWMFDGHFPRSPEDALKIIEACLFLGVQPSDTISTAAWHTMAMKIKALEERLS